ncbi:oxygen-independent coproporphyrinogen III oxidase [Flavobacterium sp. J49]|uniref:oxygen-independent coproporphyrinogen III oxidase n=1 Tax=Flavobacterium sp. J49 TaxID=2718534 RepID=UPI001593F146|nr:oxygen-independent coproporphyrinogen III oxidase [Flavobacterium sp. J49]MBF6642188.1 oxygen-independent coproporphyrinogen III oxidase [Flavobacterium sp. J49]NIC03435.1 oxygen-independent coproporphyrinogen III oxidase [Flavobacterium sp. J49]
MSVSLVQKYNVPGPRYTSYPTVPYWDEASFSDNQWKETFIRSFNESNATEGISLYIHLPFCESLCTFCGCHKRITKRHEVENPYIEAVLKEWQLYCDLFPAKPLIKEIHLGGGTPTFFSPEHLEQLITGILSKAEKATEYEFSFEGHPNNTTREHLQKLYNLGFRRVSFGVQDYSEKVQIAIHRHQPFHNVAKVTFWAKEIGYTSISHDLVFGLPFQTLDNVIDTIEKTNSLSPNRLAFYSYAHVPWIKGNGQRGFKDEDVPKDDEKRKLYEVGKTLLAKKGYHEIGMDHFALEDDAMYHAFKAGKLHRNFMGYTASKTQLMIGLGVSSISDSWYAFAQNEKELETYYARLAQNELPVYRGHVLTEEDLIIRRHILNLMCQFNTSWQNDDLYFEELPEVLEQLHEMELDGLLQIKPNGLVVTEKGKAFVRNICMAFDLRLKRKTPQTQLFSMTV